MHVDVKVSVWQRIWINNPDTLTKDDIIQMIKNGSPNNLFDNDELNCSLETVDDTETYLSPEDNNGFPTIQLLNDYNECLWDNTQE